MSLTSEMLDAMLLAGCSAEQIVAVVKADIAAEEARAETKRAKDAERKRRQRHSDSSDVTACHAESSGRSVTDADTADPFPPCPPSFPPNPQTTPLNPPNPRGAQKRGTRISDDWQPSEEGAALAKQLGVDASAETEKFRDYWRAKAGKDGTKLDWDATWRNWVRRSAESQKALPSNRESFGVSGTPWPARLRRYTPGGFWSNDWGPRPEDGNPAIPTDVLAEWRKGLAA